MQKILSFIRRTLLTVTTYKHALWMVLLAYVIVRLVPSYFAITLYNNNFSWPNLILQAVLRDGVVIALAWFIIKRIAVFPVTFISFRIFVTLYFFASIISTLISLIITSAASLIPLGLTLESSTFFSTVNFADSIIVGTVFWSLFISGLLLVKSHQPDEIF